MILVMMLPKNDDIESLLMNKMFEVRWAKNDQYCMAKVVAKVGLNLRAGELYSELLKMALLLLMGCL